MSSAAMRLPVVAVWLKEKSSIADP